MQEQKETLPLEEEIAVVDGWINSYVDNGEVVEQIDGKLLRNVLEALGANFEISEDEKRTLGRQEYSNKRSKPGMLAVWGRRYEEYIEWVQQWIEDYEKRSENKLPALGGRYEAEGIKRSAMVQFLGVLTSFAALEDKLFDFGDIKTRFDARHYNGRIRQAGFTKKKSRYHIYVPGYNRVKQLKGEEVVERELPFAPAGYPPEFPKDAWAHIKSWQ